jgi:hypothetical protein
VVWINRDPCQSLAPGDTQRFAQAFAFMTMRSSLLAAAVLVLALVLPSVDSHGRRLSARFVQSTVDTLGLQQLDIVEALPQVK